MGFVQLLIIVNDIFQSPEERGFFTAILESVYRFTLGSVAGGMLINISTAERLIDITNNFFKCWVFIISFMLYFITFLSVPKTADLVRVPKHSSSMKIDYISRFLFFSRTYSSKSYNRKIVG